MPPRQLRLHTLRLSALPFFRSLLGVLHPLHPPPNLPPALLRHSPFFHPVTPLPRPDAPSPCKWWNNSPEDGFAGPHKPARIPHSTPTASWPSWASCASPGQAGREARPPCRSDHSGRSIEHNPPCSCRIGRNSHNMAGARVCASAPRHVPVWSPSFQRVA